MARGEVGGWHKGRWGITRSWSDEVYLFLTGGTHEVCQALARGASHRSDHM